MDEANWIGCSVFCYVDRKYRKRWVEAEKDFSSICIEARLNIYSYVPLVFLFCGNILMFSIFTVVSMKAEFFKNPPSKPKFFFSILDRRTNEMLHFFKKIFFFWCFEDIWVKNSFLLNQNTFLTKAWIAYVDYTSLVHFKPETSFKTLDVSNPSS